MNRRLEELPVSSTYSDRRQTPSIMEFAGRKFSRFFWRAIFFFFVAAITGRHFFSRGGRKGADDLPPLSRQRSITGINFQRSITVYTSNRIISCHYSSEMQMYNSRYVTFEDKSSFLHMYNLRYLCHIMTYYLISCHIMTYYVILCHIMSYHDILCHIMSYHDILCHIMSYQFYYVHPLYTWYQ